MLGALSQIADAAVISDNPLIKHTRSQSELKLDEHRMTSC